MRSYSTLQITKFQAFSEQKTKLSTHLDRLALRTLQSVMNYPGNAKSIEASTVYEVWRDRFLRDRLRPAVGIAIFFAFTITVYFLGERFFARQEFKSVYL